MELIGRQREQLETIERLRTRRLVTVIGPAGIGKTALARAVADQVGDDYELGVHHVDLTRIDAPQAVAGALAAQLGFSSFDALLTTVAEQPVLLVVDNCEHVTAAAASAIAELLVTCKTPTVLATSRSPLGVAGESLLVLGPLGLPAPGQGDGDSDAVRLFVERAVDAGARLRARQSAAVTELCRRLDGVPLAIELAAAQTRVLQPSEILDRLSHGIEVLARPRFQGDHRHRSLGATIEWSYRLLPDPAAAMFERLGLFAGPFTADLAEAVASDVGLELHDASEALGLLVDSSLVVAEPAGDTIQFRLLQTVRSFAVQRLHEQGTLDEARRQLADHVVDAALEVVDSLSGRQWDPALFDRLVSLYDTIESTVRWCLSGDTDPRRALLLCGVLLAAVSNTHTEEIRSLCDAVLERWPDPSLPGAADTVATAATARCLVGDPDSALALAEQALPHAERSPIAPVTLRRAMAYAANALGDGTRAMRLFEETATLARERGLVAFALEAEVNRARLLADDPDYGVDDALQAVAAARREAAACGSPVNELLARTVAANLVLRTDLPAGLDLARDVLQSARHVGYPSVTRYALRSLAWAATRSRDYRAAAAALRELFDVVLARGAVGDVKVALYATAELLHATADPAWAPIAATADSLPRVGLALEPADPAPELPPTGAVGPLPPREAIVLARHVLQRLLTEPPETPAPPAAAAPGGTPASPARIVDRGEFWEISFADRVIHATPSKGLNDIARLLRDPGREIHCLDLMGASVEQPSTGNTIDDTARRQYEQRVRDLQSDMDAAEADNDPIRAVKAQIELDTLVEHLTVALGLGGRHRRGGGSTERARSAVTQRIRATIRRLAHEHPELARHLEVSITTGIYCAYRPEHHIDWEITSDSSPIGS